MLGITAKLSHAINLISDHGNAAASKFMVYFGVGGSSVGVASGLTQRYAEPEFIWFTLTEWGSVVGIAGGLSLIIKLIVDWYYRRKQDKREQEVHDRKYGL